MDLFTQVKMAVSVKEAAEYYGLEVKCGSMVCCPFHNDRTPSMKLNEDYFYCFGCGATGDVIDLVAKLFNLSSYDAAKKLADDFGIDPDKPPAAAALRKTKYPLAKTFQNETLHCQRILCDYRRTGDDFSATAPCTYVRFTFLKRRYMKNSDYIFGHEIKPSEIRKLFA